MVMINTDITDPVKIDRYFTLCTRLTDKLSLVYVDTFLFGSKTKCYRYLCSLGTVYAKRSGNEFRRPLLTYKTFCEYTKKDCLVHVASTGTFAGRFMIQKKKKI
jgi:hypothetical protein